MSKDGGPDRLLSIAARASADLESHQRSATRWRVVDTLFLVPAALGAVCAIVLAITAITGIWVAAAIALGAAALAGTSVLLDFPARARRAELAASYLAAFLAEAGEVPSTREREAELRRWFLRIHSAVTAGADELDLDLLEGGVGALAVNDGNGGGSRPGSRVHVGRRPGTPHHDQLNLKATERAGARHLHRLWWAFLLAVVFLVIEGVAAYATGSLSLLSDAGHVLADGVGLAMALAAVHISNNHRRRDPSRTFGMYRLEIMAALANAALLVAVAGYVMVEGFQRMDDPPEVPGGVLLVVAVAGLAANLVSFWLLKPGAAESLNVKAAYLDVAADAVASVGVLVGGLVIHFTGSTFIDPLVGILIGLWILPRAWQLGREAVRVLVQAAPPEVDMRDVEADLCSVPGVAGVHRLHLWTLTSDLEVASAHLIVRPGADLDQVLDEAQLLLQDRYRVAHTTLQLEPDGKGCAHLDW